ncbi:MAG: LLM class flavin-dependent oxidoreductase [Actinomycetota bacterium]
MRIGLDLRAERDPDRLVGKAVEADRLGLWAVLIGTSAESGGGDTGSPDTGLIDAAAVAAITGSIHIALAVDAGSEHPLTLAEEIAVLDHLSIRRMVVLVEGPSDRIDHMTNLLDGAVVDGVALAPPPAQTSVPVRTADRFGFADLTGSVTDDAPLIDDHRDGGCTHLFVTWPGPLPVLARHLVTRAAGPGFPAIVADMADRIAPHNEAANADSPPEKHDAVGVDDAV